MAGAAALTCILDSDGEAAVSHGGLHSGLCGDLEGRDGGGREARGAGNMCVRRPDSHCVQQEAAPHGKAVMRQ